MLLTNWLNTINSRIRKRRVFRSRDRRDIRKRWQSIIQNQISTTEALEDRTLLTTFFVDDSLVITNNQGDSGLDAGDTVTFASGEAGETTGLIFGTNAFDTIQDAVDAAQLSVDPTDIINIAAGTYNENVTVGTAVQFVGAGTGDTFVGGTGNLFTVTADDVSFQDMNLQMLNASQGIRVNSAVDNLQVDNVRFSDISTYGIEIHNDAVLTNLSVTNSFFVGTGGTGIRMATTAVADGIHVNNTEFDGMRNAINEASNNTVTGGHLRDLQVTNSTFQNISDVSIYAEDMRDSNISGNDFFGNPAGDTERDIVLNNKYSANGMAFGNIQITNNDFENSDRPAIQLDSRAEAITGAVNITGNTMNSDIGTLTYSWTRIDVNLNSNYNHAPVNINNNSITFTGNASAGSTGTSAISLSGGSDAITISGNTLTDNTTLGGYTTTGIFIATDNSYSGAISPTAVIDISNNIITGFDTAIALYDAQTSSSGGLTAGAQVNINNNSLAGNTTGISSGAGAVVNASGNWWGITDETAIAALMTGAVDFSSYLDDSTDTDGGTAGFQGDFSVVNVTAQGEQTGPLSRIQEAVEAVTPGGTINIASGTYAGNVDATLTGINKNVRLVPGSGPGQVVIDGDLKLDSNDFLDIEVNGTIAGTEYDQFVVNGDLTLGGATLNLIDGYTPDVAESFILIDNDGPSPVTGTFNGFPEGHEFTDFLGVVGLSAFLTYAGGDGNDVAIYTEIPSPVVTIPADGAADEYSLQIVGGNVIITEVGSGNVISNTPLDALGGTLVINGEAGENDTLTIDMTGIDETTDLQIEFHGGTGGFDTLELVNGSLSSIEFLYLNASDGSIQLNGSGSNFISYTGLEPITSTINATNVTLNYSGVDETITVTDAGGGQTTVSSTSGESTTFNNPTGTLTINAGDGTDIIDIDSLVAGFGANIIINGGNGADTINVNSSISLAAGKSIQFNSEDVVLTGDVNSDAISGTAGTVNITGSASGAEIQDAIDLAASGATINVAAGTYAEDVIVDKSVILQGANAGIAGNGVRGAESLIDPSSPFGIEVRADDVTIDGFEITGLDRDGINVRPTNSGPGISTRGNIVIQNNHIHETFVPGNQINGIVFGEQVGGGPDSTDMATISFVTISDNFIDVTDDNTARGIVMTGHFASIHYDNFDITGNVIQAKNNGLFIAENPAIYTAAGIEILNNTFESPGSVGINAGNLDSTSKVNGNTFINNASGAYLNFAEPGGEVLNNIFENNTNVGLFFFDDTYFPQSSENPTVTGNTFTNNGRQVGSAAPAVDLDAIQNNNTLDAGVKVSSNSNLYGNIQDAIDNAMPGDDVTVVINATYTENVDVNQAVTLMGEATVDGSVTASVAGATIAPGFSPGIFASTDLILTGGSSLNVEIDGNSGVGVTGGHDQFVTTGNVNLGGATLDTTGSDITGATLGDTFEIIDVGGTLTGTFAGLDNGDSVLVNGQTFRIFYNGGDGNDVVLTFLPPVPVTYVDTTFTGVYGTFITDADPNQTGDQNAVIGVNAFDTIQEAIDLATSGATINIAAGTYNENVNVDKSVVLDGAGTTDTFIDNTGNLFTVTADDVSFQDMTLQNATQGIRVDLFATSGTADNLQIDNVHFVNMSSRGIEIHNNTTVTNMTVADSLFQNTGTGIRLASSAVGDGIDITNSVFDGGTLGFYQSNDGSTGNVRDLQVSGSTFRNFTDTAVFAEEIRDSSIDGNTFEDNRRDFTLFKAYTSAGTPVENLQIINNDMTDSTQTAVIIYVTGSGLGSGVDISNNTITSDVGLLSDERGKIDIYLNAAESHAPINITENSITFSGTFATAEAVYGIKVRGGSDSINIERNTLDGGGVGSNGGTPLTSGIYVQTNDAGMGATSSSAVINVLNNSITGFDTAVSVFDAVNGLPGGLTPGAQLNINNNSLAGNSLGVFSGLGAAVNASGNWWGITDETAIAALMTGAVDFSSYLDDSTDTDGGTAGFQGDFSIVNVTALGAQTGPAGRIEEALQAVTPGGTININSGIYAGNVDATLTGVDKSVTLVPGSSPGQVVINGDLILNGDDTLDIEINGQTAGSGYDQFIVNGAVVLNSAALNLTNTYTPVDGDKFTLIDNDAADGITGAFVGYPEGHEFTNFLGSGLNAYLTYVGGDGNDVVIHMEDSNPEITVPNNGTADQYTLEIVGGNFVLSETGSGTIISTFPVAAINGPLVIHGEDGQDDTLTIDLDTIDHTTDIQIEFRGGTGGNDTLILERTGAVNSVEHVFTSASDGSIYLDGETQATIVYTGLEPIDDTILADNRIFSYTGAAETITLEDDDDVDDDESRISSTLGESVTFDHSTLTTITIRTTDGTGADNIHIEGLDGNFDANLIIEAGVDSDTNDDDTVIFQTNTTNVTSGNVSVTAGSITLNAAVTTSGDVALDATNGSISGTSLVTATNADLRATGNVGASGTEVELAVDALEADVDGSLYVNDAGALSIGYTTGSTLTGVSVGGASTITSGGTLSVTEDITATGSGTIRVESSGGNVEMDSGTQIDGDDGDVEVIADNNVELGLVTTTADVTVTATAGAITDINGGSNNINAVNATLNAGTGAGVGDALETTITALEANTGAGLEVDDAGTLNIGFAGGIVGVTVGAPSRIESTGTLTVTEDITASGGNLQLENTGGNFVLNASTTISNGGFSIQVDSANDLTVNGTVQTTDGAISLRADNQLDLGATSIVQTTSGTSTATVTLAADFDDNNSGALSQDEGSVVDAQDGALNVTAYGNIEIADLRGATVQVDSEGGAILDNTSPGEAPLITATNAYLEAGTSVGTGEDIDTAVSTLAGRSQNGQFRVSNSGALTIGTVGGFPAGVIATSGGVTITAASPMIIANNVSGSGSVILTSTDAAGPGDDLTINGGVTVESTAADVVLNSGDDFLLTLGGTVRAATTIEINVDPITDGTGATVDLLGNVDATLTTINGGDDSDTFNILPTQDSPITINGGDPTLPTVPGDVLNLDFSGLTSAPVLTLGVDAGSGAFSFLAPDTELPVNYSSIENVNTSAGAYHLVLDMFVSGFQDTAADTIDATVDNSDTDLLLDINGGNFFTGAVADILSFTTVGSTDDETLNINENANGVLPFFQEAAPVVTGSAGSHLNASANTYLDATYPPAYTVDDITIHYDGGAGTDSVNVNFTTDHNAAYFTDIIDAAGSGNITSSTIADTDIDLGLSFARLEGVGFSGTAAGELRVDASSNSFTNNIAINDDGNAADGISQIVGNMQFTDVLFEGFSDLQVLSGTGAELLDLIGLDSATTLTNVVLNASDILGTDAGNDTIRVRSTPAGTVTNVSVSGGLGDDLIQIFDGGNTVDNIFAAIQVFGQGGTDTLTLTDSGDGTGDTFEVTSTTIEGISSSPGTDVTFTDIDALNVTGTGGNDTINVNLGAQLDLNTVTINGSGGDDTFNLNNSTPVGVDTRLNGEAGLDEFIFLASNVLRGFINGGADVDTIDYSGYTPVVHVALSGIGSVDGFQGRENNGSILGTGVASLAFDNIDDLVGTAGVDTLEGPDLRNYWGITSTDEGFIIADRVALAIGRPTTPADATATPPEERLDFTSFQNLIGGSQDDRFDLTDGAGLTGTLNGGSGNDSLDYRDFTTDVTVNLFAGTATNIGGGLVVGTGGGDDDNSIENVFGGNGDDNITGDNDNNILGDGLGNDFLDGGGNGVGSGNGGDDVFLMEPGAGGSADVITDIHGNDTVDFRFASAGIVFDVDIINTPQDVFGGNTVELRQIQPEQPDTNPSFMENVVGSQFDDYIYIDPLSQDGNFPIDGPPVLRSADGQGGTDFLDFDAKGQEVIDTGFSLTADGVGTVQYLNFENITPFEDNPAFIVDNGDPGFTITGDWPYHPPGIAITNGIGFEDDIHSVAGLDPYGTGPAQAFWEFFGLTPGEYRVSVTWPESSNPFAATDAPFTIFDGARTEIGGSAVDLGTYDVNQQVTPDDYSADGTTWEILDTFTVNSRTLTVMLTNLADGLITADAIRIERVSDGPEIELVDVTDALAPPTLIVDGHPDGIQFGPTELLTDAVRTFEITNNGSAVLNISNILLPAGYTTDLTPQAVGIGSTISFTITMGSDSFGDRSGIFSFDTDDVDESTFNILLDGQVSNVVIIDDGDVEFTATPGFESFDTRVNEGSYGYEGDISGAVPNDPGNTPAPATETATWTFTGLAEGNYRVSTTWSELFNRVTDAPFSLDGGAGTLDIDVDQSVAPSSFIEDGTAWFDLSSSFSVSAAGQLVVTLTNEASNFIRDHYDLANGVIADAIRIEYLPEPDLEITVDGGTVVDDDTGVVDFGSTIAGIPVIKEFTITNLSGTDVDVTGLIEFPPGFSIDPTSPFGTDNVPFTISAGGSVVFRIQFDGGTNGTTFGQISFTTGDADENPFNFTVRGESGPATVEITDPEFSTTGTWESYTPGNVGDPQFLTAGEEFVTGTGANAATWEFDVEPGRYQVVAHWYVNPDVTMNGHGAAPNAPYTIFGGAVPVTVLVNQQISSNDFLDDGIYWEYIGNPVEITGNSLSVQLTDLADGLVYADEIRIYRVVDPVIDVQVDGETLSDGDTVNFDDTIVGAPVVKTFTVTNYGERNMALAPITVVPAGFSLVSGFGSTNLAPGTSTTFTLQMDAGSSGSFSGVVSFGVDSSDANPFNFTVSGSASETMIIDNGDIGYSTTGDWVSKYATSIYDYYENDQDELPSDNLPGTSTATWDFTNLAAGTYSISSHWAAHSGMASNAQFEISGIQGGDITVTLDQRFAANDFTDAGVSWETLGTFQVAAGGSLTITLLDDGGPGKLAADAMRLDILTSVAPEIEVAAGAVSLTSGSSSLDLGTAFFGESLFQTFTITNTGTDTLNLGAVVPPAAPGFSISVPLGTTTLFAGQSTTFEVEFNNTTVAGLSSGTLTIPNDDADEDPFTIDLSATMDPSLIVDDGDAGFSSSGGFYATSWLTYFQLDTRQLNAGDNGTATWDFSSLPAGSYTVYATWSAHGSLATNAEYSINAGGPIVVNQRVAPNDLNSDGANWGILGVVNVLAGGSISVELTDNAADGRIRADAIRIERTGPLMAAAGASTSNAPAITQSDLDSVRDAALDYWKATGLSETQISLLESVNFVLADLPDAMLGGATTTTILIDINAAGYGWFVDDTPFDSSEFSLDADGDLVAGIGSAAFGQMDLLTVMLHEMGHTLGYDDLDSDDSLMGETLDASERRLPEIDDFFSGVAEGDNPLLD